MVSTSALSRATAIMAVALVFACIAWAAVTIRDNGRDRDASPVKRMVGQTTTEIRRDELSRSVEAAGVDWTVFRAAVSSDRASANPLADLRLVGYFIAFESGSDADRRAVISNTRTNTQYIVAEGDQIPGFTVISIYRDHVLLKSERGQEEKLYMTVESGLAGSGSLATSIGVAGSTNEPAARFGGRKTGDRSWVFGRDTLLGYYHELTDSPRRLLTVFDSFEPAYDAEQKIRGYNINIQGEPDFFNAVGLTQGDRVVSVNSVPMTNRGRAEHFIRQFVAGNSTAFVLAVERAGQVERLVYQIQPGGKAE